MKKRIQRKISHLREQPEHIRSRAASRFTIIAGVILVLLWVTVLLPLQLRLQGGNDSSDEKAQQQYYKKRLVSKRIYHQIPIHKLVVFRTHRK